MRSDHSGGPKSDRMKWNKRKQFGLGSLLVTIASLAVVFGLLSARYKTVARFNHAYALIEDKAWKVLLSQGKTLPSVYRASHPAGLFTSGRLAMSVTDDKTFYLGLECRSSSLLYGKPVLTITTYAEHGTSHFDAEASEKLCSALIEELPFAEIAVVHKEQAGTARLVY